jgi:hypothetical protein
MDHFDNLRRARMSIVEKALENDLHSAIRARETSRLDTAYAEGADLIAGVFQLSAGEILLCIAIECKLKAD